MQKCLSIAKRETSNETLVSHSLGKLEWKGVAGGICHCDVIVIVRGWVCSSLLIYWSFLDESVRQTLVRWKNMAMLESDGRVQSSLSPPTTEQLPPTVENERLSGDSESASEIDEEELAKRELVSLYYKVHTIYLVHS